MVGDAGASDGRLGRGYADRMSRPDHHDPTAGVGGAPPAQSALSLRLVLALFGVAVCAVLAAVAAEMNAPTALIAVTAALALAAAVDAVVVVRRKLAGEPG